MTSEEPNPEQTSDLIDTVHHEHAHLRRLFDDLASSFADIAAGETGASSQQDVVAAATEDLEVALEEMIHHFNQEEEIFFVDMERRFPELQSEIDDLVEAHEVMAQRTRWLHEQLDREPEDIARDLEVIVDVLRSLASLVEEHTEKESQLFDTVLQKIPADERRDLLETMREI